MLTRKQVLNLLGGASVFLLAAGCGGTNEAITVNNTIPVTGPLNSPHPTFPSPGSSATPTPSPSPAASPGASPVPSASPR